MYCRESSTTMLVWTFVTATSLGTLVAGGIIRSSSSSIDFSQRLTREPDSYDGVSNAVDKLTSLSLVPEVAGLDFDPKNYADADMWNLYADVKGEHLVCLMQATDKGAGFLIEDKRTPPSAASPWTGDLKSEQLQRYRNRSQAKATRRTGNMVLA